MTRRPQVSVVVATHNRAERLQALIEGLGRQTVPRDNFEVVIVDDASTDTTQSVLAAAMGSSDLRLEVEHLEENSGSGVARQVGWQTASGNLVVFTDDDCLPEPTWLEELVAVAEANPGAVVQGATLPAPGELEALPSRRRAFARSIRVDALDPGFQTCNILYPRDLLVQLGGFDVSEYPRYPGEDSDLGLRAIRAGASALFAGRARVFHAVNDLGGLGKLRHAARWDMKIYAREPALRRAHFYRWGIFWKRTHYFLVLGLVGALVPRRLWPVRILLARPYARSLYGRARAEGSGLVMIPYYLVFDLTEVLTVVRGAVRYRTPMI